MADASGTYELHTRDAFPPGVQARINALRGIDTPLDPTIGPLCDGSTDLRFGYSEDGGFVDLTYSFTNPHGHWFLFVDGQCNYYVSMSYEQGVVTGTLDAQQAEDLALSVEWDAIDELTGADNESCDDGTTSSLWMPAFRRTSCTCGCGDGSIGTRKDDALDAARALTIDLAMNGQRVTGPIAALAAEGSPMLDDLAWPLAQPIASVPNLVHDLEDLGASPEYALFDADDAMALRELRAQQELGRPLSVTDGQATYRLWIRDELPAGVSQAIRRFQGISP